MRKSILEDKNLQLQKLGLTPLQAKIYTSLLESGKEKILAISKTALVDRSNTYRTILQLQRIGLVDRMLGTPNSYFAIALKEAVSILINLKKDQFGEMQKIAQELTQSYPANDTKPQESEYEVTLCRWPRIRHLKVINDCCENAKESIDLLLNKKTFEEGLIGLANAQLACVRRGVKYRVVTENINSDKIQKKLEAFIVKPNFQLRTIFNSPLSEVAIVDQKYATVNLVLFGGMGQVENLVTNHPGCIEMFQNHFDKVWNDAKKTQFRKQSIIA
jgi:sugar-specific transcriptional regulator TrmB